MVAMTLDLQKCFPYLLGYSISILICVMTKFLGMNVTGGKDGSTAATMLKSVDDLFSEFDLH